MWCQWPVPGSNPYWMGRMSEDVIIEDDVCIRIFIFKKYIYRERELYIIYFFYFFNSISFKIQIVFLPDYIGKGCKGHVLKGKCSYTWEGWTDQTMIMDRIWRVLGSQDLPKMCFDFGVLGCHSNKNKALRLFCCLRPQAWIFAIICQFFTHKRIEDSSPKTIDLEQDGTSTYKYHFFDNLTW